MVCCYLFGVIPFYSGTSILRNAKGLPPKNVPYNEVSLYRGSFLFTSTGARKIVRYTEDFVI